MRGIGVALASLLALLSTVVATPVQAGEDEQIALQAQLVHSQLCAGIGKDVSRAAASLSLLSDTWGEVSDAYEASSADFLLYWRGLLGQCLGQNELAGQDLLEFVRITEGKKDLLPLARDARTRLRRLGVRLPRSTKAAKRTSPAGEEGGAQTTGTATADAASRSESSWGQRVHIGLGLGYQRTADWNYLVVGIDATIRIVGPLGIGILVRPGFSELVAPNPSLLFAFGVGPVVRIPGKVEPLFGAALQLAPNPGGGEGDAFLVGVAGIGGVEVPLGPSPLALRVAAEVGVLSQFFCLRVLGGVTLRFG
ncbi:MAG TPA: hypothetical protein DIU15_19455 [Deltaproteobacteria bacterium]|nr:hypothetical protein [Deltaproteobacteria bacterium]